MATRQKLKSSMSPEAFEALSAEPTKQQTLDYSVEMSKRPMPHMGQQFSLLCQIASQPSSAGHYAEQKRAKD